MLDFFSVSIFLFLAFLVGTIFWYVTIPKNLPPGPAGLPFIGSLWAFRHGSDQHLVLLDIVKKYGPIVKVYIAHKLFIILGDYDTIQEALVKNGDVYAGRPQIRALVPKKAAFHGLINSEGDLWKEQRRFALSTLRDFGIGRPIIEPKIKEELEYLSERIQNFERTGSSFDPQPLLLCAVSNIVSQLIFGRRFDYDDQEFVDQFTAFSRRVTGSGVGFFNPVLFSERLAAMAVHLPLLKRLGQEVESFLAFTEREMNKTVKTFDPESEPMNYIHAYMKAAREHQGQYFTDNQLITSVTDLFGAGTETTSTTIRFGLLLLATYPEIQERMYNEIKDQVGTDSIPDYADRMRLPFCEAVVYEIQRFANLVPFGVPRRNLQPTKLLGYDIPEGTIVIPFLTSVLHNPKVFPEPEKFNPSRFLDSSGKVNRDPKLIPFQAGKRICLGEPLARIELFVLLVGLVSRFRFYFRDDKPKPTLKPMVGLICAPRTFEVYVEARND